jgi:thiol:disulfide interchange protein DsbD
MIPMTVSFLPSKVKQKRKALVLCMGFNYCYLCSSRVLVTWIFGADALNALSTNVWFNIIFFVLLVVFCGFILAFEIMLPNSWANKVDSQADRGGIIEFYLWHWHLQLYLFLVLGQ